MKLFTDKDGRIAAIGSTERTDLTEINVHEDEYNFPFTGWSQLRILCYKIGVVPIDGEDGWYRINMMTPYVPTHMMSAIESLENKNAEIQSAQDEINALTLEIAADHEARLCEIELGV